MPKIVKILNVSQRALYCWFDRFSKENLKSIYKIADRGRRPPLNIQKHVASVRIYIKKST